MSEITHPSNKILAAVPAESRDHVFSNLELVSLNFGEYIQWADDPIKHLYFPQSGVISLITSAKDSSFV